MKKIEYKQALNPDSIHAKDLDPNVTGYDFGIPGLAVRKVLGHWQLDHIASGYRAFSNLHKTRAECVSAALRAQAISPIDWTVGKETLLGKHHEAIVWHWKNDFLGHARSARFSEETVCHDWTMRDLETFTYNGLAEGLCGACGEVSGNHETDATNNWCPCCDKKKVTSALVLAGLI